MPRARRTSASTVGAGLLALLVVALPLWRGGVDWPAQLLAALLAPLALLLATSSEARLPWAGLPLLIVLGVIGLQLLPLPPALHALSPSARGLFESALGPLGLYPAARPLSLDPPATSLELAKAAAGLCAFGAGWAAGAGRRRRAIVLGAIGAAGLGAAGVVVAGALMGATPILAPRFPFVNPNHLAGLAVLTTFPQLALALRAHGQARLLWLLGFVVTSAIVFLSLSRGGIGAYVLGAGIFAVLMRRRAAADRGPGRPEHLTIAAGVVGALGVAAYLALDPLLGELASSRGISPEPKTALWQPALSMARDHLLLGVGGGAFETAFPAYKSEPDQVTFTHLENEWLQPLVELGLPAGLLLVATLGIAWLAAARRRDLSWSEVGLLAGTGALAGQNLVDFSLDLLGVSVPFMAALGLASRGAGPVAARRWVLTAAALFLGAGGLVGLAFARSHPPESESRLVAGAADPEAVVAAALEAVRRRPADYLPQAVAGVRLVSAGRCAAGLPWLTRAMLLNPTAPEPHLQAARCLAASGQRVLALREFRLAWTYGGFQEAVSQAARWYPGLEDLLLVAPATPDGLRGLAEFLAPSRPGEAAQVYRRALEESGDGRLLVPLARSTWASGDPDGALTLARQRVAQAAGDVAAYRLAADVLLASGDEPGAIDEARRGLAAVPGAAPLLGFLFERAIQGRRFSEARRLASEIEARSPAEVATKLLLEARALAAQGRMGEAIEVARAATAALPLQPSVHLALADYCARAGRFDDAIAAVERAAALPGQAPAAYRQRLESLAAGKAAQAERRLLQGLDH